MFAEPSDCCSHVARPRLQLWPLGSAMVVAFVVITAETVRVRGPFVN